METGSRLWHHLDSKVITDHYNTDPEKGLSSADVTARQAKYGRNIIAQGKRKSAIVRFLLQFHNPLIYILLFSATVALIMGSLIDSIIIYGVVLINAIISFIQEDKAEKAISSLSGSLVTNAAVVRDGVSQSVDARELVPGDIVLLASGAKVPADLRLIKNRDLQVVEGVLTGESAPVEKDSTVLLEEKTQLGDRINMAYASTLVTYGQATGIVVETGNTTEIGKISQMLSQAENLETPLTIKFQEFSKMITYVIIGFALVAIAVGYFREGTLSQQSLLQSIALAVGAIPEGLPAAITITLAIGVGRMAQRKVIIRKLPAVETLGSTTVICSDKTGTITKNQMTVKHIYAGGKMFDVDGTGYAPKGDITFEGIKVDSSDETTLRECLVAGLLCNDSRLVDNEGIYEIHGDPTEGALIVAAEKEGMTYDAMLKQLPRVDAIPFESQYQYMATLHRNSEQSVVYVKGSLEALLIRSDKMVDEKGQAIAIDKKAITEAAASLSKNGIRVLTIARLHVDSTMERLDHEHLEKGLTVIGLQGMIDPPRQEVIESVAYCKRAGIDVKMITGDHVLTAVAIGEQIGLFDHSAPHGALTHLSGKELEEMDDATLLKNLKTLKVFARVTPEQKLRLVKLLQTQSNIVAMTGDGVNDAPALKQANIGVAMAITGTDVSKEAADIVLTDDNFASIYAAVEEGRAVYDNLVKIIMWTLPTNIGIGLIILTAVFLNIELPIMPSQILWINMTMAGVLGLTLAFEPQLPGIMERNPRDSSAPILSKTIIWRTIFVGALMTVVAFLLYQYIMKYTGESIDVARTIVVNTIVGIGIFYLLSCRSGKSAFRQLNLRSNPMLLPGISMMIALQAIFTYVPFMHTIFHGAAVELNWIGAIAGASFATFLIIELYKVIENYFSKS